MTRILVPAATLILVIVGLVSLAGWNRSREPRVRITLTERELRLATLSRESHGEDAGAQLRIDFTPREDPLDARNWLSEDRLRGIGFVFDVLPGAPEAADAYRRALPKIAWVALEYEGESWRAIERRRTTTQAQPSTPPLPFRHGLQPEPSRLVPVDAASDLQTLLLRYPERHLILRASIELVFVPPARGGPFVYGRIRHLIPPTVHVPRTLRAPLVGLAPGFAAPRYQIDVAVGPLGLPYVTAVRPLSTSTR